MVYKLCSKIIVSSLFVLFLNMPAYPSSKVHWFGPEKYGQKIKAYAFTKSVSVKFWQPSQLIQDLRIEDLVVVDDRLLSNSVSLAIKLESFIVQGGRVVWLLLDRPSDDNLNSFFSEKFNFMYINESQFLLATELVVKGENISHLWQGLRIGFLQNKESYAPTLNNYLIPRDESLVRSRIKGNKPGPLRATSVLCKNGNGELLAICVPTGLRSLRGMGRTPDHTIGIFDDDSIDTYNHTDAFFTLIGY